MVDLAKCHGTGCPLREGCYRFTAPAHPFRQAYAGFTCDPEKGCPHFLPARKEEPKHEAD